MKKETYLLTKFVVISLIGVIVFFVPVKANGGNTIIIDLIVSYLLNIFDSNVKWFILGACVWGVFKGVQDKIYKKSKMHMVMYTFRILGLIFCMMYITGIGPTILYNEKILPFLFDNICRSIVFLVPVGGACLCLLTDFGLMEFVGNFLEKTMRKIWKVPGVAAVDAITSFVGSFSIGFLLTDKMYTAGKYTYKEAMIIATGFSTVSTTFMITLSKNLNILDLWVWFFLISFVVNLIVTAIVLRLWPIRTYNNSRLQSSIKNMNLRMMDKVYERINRADAIPILIKNGFVSGVNMVGIMIPTILSIGTIGMFIVMNTKFFDVVAYLFHPFVSIFFNNENFVISKALSTTIIDTFLPVSFVKNMDVGVRFFCGIIAVTEILFMTASIPTLMATNIPVKLRDLIVVWFERMVVSIIVAGAFTKLLELFL